MRKKCSSDREKLLKFEAECREFRFFFDISRTIYCDGERSEQFLKQNAFLTYSSRIEVLEKKYWDAGKVRKVIMYSVCLWIIVQMLLGLLLHTVKKIRLLKKHEATMNT